MIFITDTKKETKQINRITRSIIILIISIVLLIMIPILSGVVALPFMVLGQPAAYIASRLISNLYGPLILIIISTVLWGTLRIIFLVRNSGREIDKPIVENIAIMLVGFVVVVCFTFKSFSNMYNLILDIGNLATSNFAKEDGKLSFHEFSIGDGDYINMVVNDVEFDGGNVQADELVEGANYHVEYLPHSKYVVKYQRK